MRQCRKTFCRAHCSSGEVLCHRQERSVSLLCQTDRGPRAKSDRRCCPRYRLGGPFPGPAEHDGPRRFPLGPVALSTGRRRSVYEGTGSRHSVRVREGGSTRGVWLREAAFLPRLSRTGNCEVKARASRPSSPGIDKISMLHLIQRCCFNTPFKLQKLPGPSLLLCGKNRTTWSSLAFQLRRDAHPLSTSLSLKPASVFTTKLQALHTSLPVFKKKAPTESEAESQKSTESLKDSPKPALYLSLGGLIPFVAVPLAMALQGTYSPELAFAQVAYGAATASFLGGMRWGFALPENSPAKPDWLNLANGTVPPLLACQALLFKDVTQGAVMLTLALGIALHYDFSLLPAYPRWFKVLRVVGTTVMILSLLATVALKALLEEEESDDRKIWQNTN